MNYEITATLGPASSAEQTWEAMLRTGATGFRLNTSHLNAAEMALWLRRLSDFRQRQGLSFPVVLDLQGSKWRLGQFAPRDLRLGETVRLVLAEASDQPDTLPVPHPDFFCAARAGGEAALNDAKTLLRIDAVEGNTARAIVLQGGEISPRKGITLANSEGRTETLNLRDQSMLDAARPFAFAQYAVSYIRDAAEMERYRALFPIGAVLIAKLERESSVREAAAIARHADALWLCRGDLGAELGMPAMAAAVHDFAMVVREARVPVFMAGQVLEHMVDHPTPTRSEVCFLYDAIRAGYAGVVLSDECAVGRYPVEAVKTAAMFRD